MDKVDDGDGFLNWSELLDGVRCSASFQALARAAPVGMGVVSDRLIRWTNQRFCDLVAYAPDELLGRSARFLYESEEEFQRVGEVKYRMMSEHGVGQVETRLQRSDGGVVPVFLSSTYLEPTDPSLGILFTAQDLTAMRRLDEERIRLAEIVDGTVDGVSTISADGEVTYFNPAGLELIGHPPGKAFTQMPVSRFFAHPQRSELFQQALLEVADKGIYEHDIQLRRWDGKTVEIHQVIMAHRDRAGKVTHYSTVMRDLTEQRRQEADKDRLSAELLHAQKMEAIGRLAGGVAHDFNNILTAISGFASLARESLRPEDPISDDIEQVILAAARASALTKQLLIFSSQQDYLPVHVNLPTVIDNLSRMLSRLLGEHIELEIRHESADLWIHADPHQIEQVLVNLAVNARDAMPRGGRLSVRLCVKQLVDELCGHCLTSLTGEYLEIVVQDTGSGMTPDTLEHLFEPFFTTKEQGKGTGLGLSVVHGVVLKSEGHIAVHSEPGEGTTFTLLFARVAPASAVKARPSPRNLSGGGETILLVEDEPAVRMLTKRMLRRLGYRVLEAGEALGAIAQFEKIDGRVDLLVCDIVLPGKSGLQLYRRLLSLKAHLPALFVSGYHEEDLESYGFSSAELDLLPKPFNSTDLGRRVREALERPAPARSAES